MVDYLRVHIIPIGFDSTRVTKPLVEKKADKVYFIRHRGDTEDSVYFKFVSNELSINLNHIETDERFVNLWDLYECIETYREIIKKEKNNHIYINVSTGSKITAIAGMLTCMLFKNAEPYYVDIDYSPQTKKVIVRKLKVKGYKSLPVFEMIKPKNEYLQILKLLKENGKMRKSNLIDELESLKVIRKKEISDKDFTTHAKHSQLNSFLSPMENEYDFIEIITHGKRSDVLIKEQGERALRIFGLDDTEVQIE